MMLVDFENRRPASVAQRARARVPRLLEYCCTLALVGTAVFAMGVMVAFAAPHRGATAAVLMLSASAGVVLAMIVAAAVSLGPVADAERR